MAFPGTALSIKCLRVRNRLLLRRRKHQLVKIDGAGGMVHHIVYGLMSPYRVLLIREDGAILARFLASSWPVLQVFDVVGKPDCRGAAATLYIAAPFGDSHRLASLKRVAMSLPTFALASSYTSMANCTSSLAR